MGCSFDTALFSKYNSKYISKTYLGQLKGIQKRTTKTMLGNVILEERWSSKFFNLKNIRPRHDIITALKHMKWCCEEGLNGSSSCPSRRGRKKQPLILTARVTSVARRILCWQEQWNVEIDCLKKRSDKLSLRKIWDITDSSLEWVKMKSKCPFQPYQSVCL